MSSTNTAPRLPPAVRLITNTLFIFVGDAVARFSNGLLYVLVGRVLGPAPAGTLNLGLTYALLLTHIAFWGLDQILTREVARQPEKAARYFNNFLSVRLLLSALLYGFLVAALALFQPYPAYIQTVILILGLMIVSENVSNLCGALLMAYERMRLFSLVNMTIMLPRFLLGALLLYYTENLLPIVLTIAGTSLLGVGINLYVVRRLGVRIRLAFDWSFWLSQLRIAMPFVIIVIFYQIEYLIDTLLLSFFHSEVEVGFYGAVTFIITGLMLIPGAYRSSIYPLISRLVHDGPVELMRLLHRSFRYLLLISVPISLVLSLLGEPIITQIYGAKFQPAAITLTIIIWSFTLLSISMPLARLMVAANKQSVIAYILGISMTVNVVVNLLLIPQLGASGAAIARLSSVSLYFILILLWARRYYPAFRAAPQAYGAIVAGFPMAAALWYLGSINLLLAIGSSTLLFLLSAYLLGAITRQDMALFGELVNKMWSRKARPPS